MNFVAQVAEFVHRQLYHPARIFLFSLAFVGVNFIARGSLLNIYGLHRDQKTLQTQMEQTRAQIVQLDVDLRRTQDPIFMARQAVDRYDLADENDLVFVFAD